MSLCLGWKVKESTKIDQCPRPEKPVEIYEFEGYDLSSCPEVMLILTCFFLLLDGVFFLTRSCPFCRKVNILIILHLHFTHHAS
jgi:hypothetical protein